MAFAARASLALGLTTGHTGPRRLDEVHQATARPGTRWSLELRSCWSPGGWRRGLGDHRSVVSVSGVCRWCPSAAGSGEGDDAPEGAADPRWCTAGRTMPAGGLRPPGRVGSRTRAPPSRHSRGGRPGRRSSRDDPCHRARLGRVLDATDRERVDEPPPPHLAEHFGSVASSGSSWARAKVTARHCPPHGSGETWGRAAARTGRRRGRRRCHEGRRHQR